MIELTNGPRRKSARAGAALDDAPKSSERKRTRSRSSVFSRASTVHDKPDTSHPLAFWAGAILAGLFSAAVWAAIIYALVRLFW
jgi:hypothetical protein